MRHLSERRKLERQHQHSERTRKHILDQNELRARTESLAAASRREAVTALRAQLRMQTQQETLKHEASRQAHEQMRAGKLQSEEAAMKQKAQRLETRMQVLARTLVLKSHSSRICNGRLKEVGS